jgi:folate-binding protein YgfZ
MSPYEAARETGAVRRRRERGVLKVTGADRIEWLNGILTNDLKPRTGPRAIHSLWLMPQGRMVTDVIVIETGTETWLDVPAPLAGALSERLDRMIFAEDVRVVDVSSQMTSLGLYGPEARRFLTVALAEEPRRENAHDSMAVAIAEGPTLWTHAIASGLPGTHVYLPIDAAERLERSVLESGLLALDDGTATVLRVESGVPAFLTDIGEETIPLEAGLDDAISHTKGCYVGQEIIVRIRDRAHGRVARRLVGLRFSSDAVPPVPQDVKREGRHAGRLTSAVTSPAMGSAIGLATLLREFIDPGIPVVLDDGTPAIVVSLPFIA